MQAIVLRERLSARVPANDSLIAATASLEGAILIHRDAHFLAIPNHLLKQKMSAAE